jgi:plasmid stabilization system protein ParE
MMLAPISTNRARRSPLAAQSMATRLLTAIETLEQHPQRGRRVSHDLYELVTVRPYVIRYRIRPNTVEVVRIRHAAQRPA